MNSMFQPIQTDKLTSSSNIIHKSGITTNPSCSLFAQNSLRQPEILKGQLLRYKRSGKISDG